VFSKIKVPFVVVGKNPSRRLDKMAHLYQHTCLVANPSDGEINDLIQKAHVNILPSFNSTGIKIKLLHALFEGRHCVVNEAMVRGTGLEAACHIGTNAESFASILLQLQHHPFTGEETELRKKLLGKWYDTTANARLLSPYLW
jgi:glycosyltransferase involved in cell wall biosynthesis